MAARTILTLRLRAEVLADLEAEARARDVPLRTFVRDLLEAYAIELSIEVRRARASAAAALPPSRRAAIATDSTTKV